MCFLHRRLLLGSIVKKECNTLIGMEAVLLTELLENLHGIAVNALPGSSTFI